MKSDLQIKKIAQCEVDIKNSTRAIELLMQVQDQIPNEDKHFFVLSLMNPQIKRRNKAQAALQFWSDDGAVQHWQSGWAK